MKQFFDTRAGQFLIGQPKARIAQGSAYRTPGQKLQKAIAPKVARAKQALSRGTGAVKSALSRMGTKKKV